MAANLSPSPISAAAMARCKGCGAEIRWLKLPSGKSMPVNPELIPYWKDPKGDRKVMTPNGEVITCTCTGKPGEETGVGYVPHWATCPEEKQFRKKPDTTPRKEDDTMEKKNTDALIQRFEAEMAKVKRPGIDKLMEYIRSSDFYTAPASTRYHLSTPGGLVQHSLNVLDALRSLLPYDENGYKREYRVANRVICEVPDESVVIMALLHDICKTYFYVPGTRNVKIKGKWKEVPTFTVNDRMPLGHGPKSAMIVKEYIKLTSEEMYAIWYHMGFTADADRLSLGAAIEKFPIIWALHNADMMASSFMEANDGNREAFKPTVQTTAGAGSDEQIPPPDDAPPAEQEPGFEEAPPING